MTFDELLNKILSTIVNPLILVVFAIALLIFIYGGIQFVMHADSSDERETGIRHLIYGVIGMAIMVSAFGIAKFVQSTLPTDTTSDNAYKPVDIDSLKGQ